MINILTNMKNKNSSVDLSKYKFIPPSKVLKTQKQTQNNAHFQSAIEPQQNERQSPLEAKVQKQNQIPKISRSISNPKINNRNSSGLAPKDNVNSLSNKPKIKAQQHIHKLTQHIAQLRNRQSGYIQQISQLKHTNEELKNKYEQYFKTIVFKNRQIQQLSGKLKYFENRNKEKCQQHCLIIESLKKVIDSQLIKITELQNKLIQGNIETNRSTEQFTYKKHFQSQYKQEQEQEDEQEYDEYEQEMQDESINTDTPDFLASTPQNTKTYFTGQLTCSLQKSLSRISESVQEMQESNLNNEKQKTQHSVLMDQIDQYLARWHKNKQ